MTQPESVLSPLECKARQFKRKQNAHFKNEAKMIKIVTKPSLATEKRNLPQRLLKIVKLHHNITRISRCTKVKSGKYNSFTSSEDIRSKTKIIYGKEGKLNYNWKHHL